MSVLRYTVADAKAASRLRETSAPGGRLLEVRGLALAAGGAGPRRLIAAAIDLDVRRGEALGLAGEQASGATQVAAALLGLAELVEGTMSFTGRPGAAPIDLDRLTERGFRDVRGREIALVRQPADAGLDPCRSVLAQVVTAIRLHDPLPRRAAVARARDLLESVGLAVVAGTSRPHVLSALDRQRARVAIALAGSPALLVCLEPTRGLDALAAADLLALLDRLRRDAGTALLLVTADLAAIAATCPQLAVVYAGQIVESGATDAVLRDPQHPYTRMLIDATAALTRPARTAAVAKPAPEPGVWPTGCRFHPRCAAARPECETTLVELDDVASDRRARCLLAPWPVRTTSKGDR